MHAARGAAQRMTAVRRRGVLPRDHLCACAVPPRMYVVRARGVRSGGRLPTGACCACAGVLTGCRHDRRLLRR